MEKHVDSVARSHKPSAIRDVSGRLVTNPWYSSRLNWTEKGTSWARLHHTTVSRNGRLMRHPGRRGARRPGRPIRVSQTHLDFKVSRQACTPGIRETATPTSGKPLYTTMSATRRVSARRSDDTDARKAARRCFGRSDRSAQRHPWLLRSIRPKRATTSLAASVDQTRATAA